MKMNFYEWLAELENANGNRAIDLVSLFQSGGVDIPVEIEEKM